jgi:hypothetical protein
MAVSAISPISNAATFIPPPIALRQLVPQDAFNRVLETSLSGPPVAPVALRAASTETQFVSALERALFNDWVNNLQRTDSAALNPGLDALISGRLGLDVLPDGSALPPVLSDAAVAQSLAFASTLTSWLNAVQLLGTDAEPSPQLGSLIDVLV